MGQEDDKRGQVMFDRMWEFFSNQHVSTPEKDREYDIGWNLAGPEEVKNAEEDFNQADKLKKQLAEKVSSAINASPAEVAELNKQYATAETNFENKKSELDRVYKAAKGEFAPTSDTKAESDSVQAHITALQGIKPTKLSEIRAVAISIEKWRGATHEKAYDAVIKTISTNPKNKVNYVSKALDIVLKLCPVHAFPKQKNQQKK